MNTLRGIFPEPKPTYKRNFILENMKQLKQMQYQNAKIENNTVTRNNNKYSDVSSRVQSFSGFKRKPLQRSTMSAPDHHNLRRTTNHQNDKVKTETVNSETFSNNDNNYNKRIFRDQGIQTENTVYGKTLTHLKNKSPVRNNQRGGDTDGIDSRDVQNTAERIQTMTLSNDSPKKQIGNKIDNKQLSAENSTINNGPPTGYKRGVVPKYIRERQKETEQEIPSDPDCPPGHVMIPDTERKETLRALRQSYADLVSILNMLPVRTDTLRTRNKKIELEKQLNKIEEGIKVFSRPKVYVKINS